ncbi:hypothetical protein GC102_30730 [Paenibacillus sp. LMG 31460]|uniref:Copper amine oxidase-like N-terminal domain-containing protein n=1 Tax=Paenibacillus germinis TaxID=2654979 RepID=A0ABX1Z9R0_9BACL|nr:stalk domain-containing protein [Paenibacillus germinis]NOU90103.1 hypothetical protein [Paenibacillus germinis]
MTIVASPFATISFAVLLNSPLHVGKQRVEKDEMEVNGMKKKIGANVVLRDGRTQVPLRFITELLGWDVKWNDADWSVTLTKAVAMGTHSH